MVTTAQPGGIDLVILPFYDWKKCEAVGFRTRDAHILVELLRRDEIRRVLVVGRPSSLPEMLATRRWWRTRRGRVVNRGAGSVLIQVHAKAFTLDVFFWHLVRPLRLRLSWWDYALRHPRTLATIRQALLRLGMDRPAAIVCTPLSAGPLGAIKPSVTIFSADDDWLHHPGITREEDRKVVTKGYEELCRVADRIVVNSSALRSILAARRPDVVHIPNGVSPEHFSGPLPSVPSDLAALPRPWIGYAGTLASRIDVQLLSQVATRLPHASFVFLGPIDHRAWIAPLRKLPNVHCLGNKHYDVLPAYLRHFDVAMIPHNVGALENRGDPIKLYEYLAAGCPVVSTPIAEIDHLARAITIAGSPGSFAAGIERYLAMTAGDRAVLAATLRASIPLERTWAHATDRLIRLIAEEAAIANPR